MLEAMRKEYEENGAIAAFPLAKEVAPYIHPKLASVEARVDMEAKHYVVNAKPLTEEEWSAEHGANDG
jgi:hypothetical protein